MKIKISESFEPLLYDKNRYVVLCGGAGSGKSEFAGRKVFYRCETEGRHRYLIMRKVRRTLKDSVIKVFLSILEENAVPFDYNKSDRIITFRTAAGFNEILFEGLDDPEKIKSIKGITSVWIEEATEFSKDDFIQVDLRLREATGHYHQIILSFNPDESRGPWLKEMFFDNPNAMATVHVSTIDDNPIKEVRESFRKRLDALNDPVYLDIYRYGRWALPKGIIFDWDVLPLPALKFDEIIYGGDFGFSVDPAAVVKIFRKADEFWIQELIYEKNLTNQDLAGRMIDEGYSPNDLSYWDSAEPKSIEELIQKGITALPAEKGQDSIRAGIDFLKRMKIHIVEGSTNLVREKRTYKWKQDRSGNDLPVPVAFNDHGISATRYAIYTHLRKGAGDAVFMMDYDIYPESR